MRRVTLLIASTIVLAGCGGPESADVDGDGEITMEEAAERSKDMAKPDPGQYRSTTEMVELNMPGAPQEVRDMMRGMLDQGAQSREFCLTPEQAEEGFAEMIKKSQIQDSCSFEKFDADSGTIDAVMICNQPGQGEGRMTMQGTGDSTSSDMRMTMEIQTPDGQEMSMVMRTQSERIGDCPG